MKSLSRVQLLATPWNAAYQAPPSLGFSRQEYWSFSFSISPSKEHPGLMSFRMDWLDLLAVQGTLQSLLQHCTEDSEQDHPHGKEMQKSKMAVWGGLTNSCEKRSDKSKE